MQVKGGGLEDSGGGSNTDEEEEEEEDEFEDAKTDLDYEDFTVSAPPQHRCLRSAIARRFFLFLFIIIIFFFLGSVYSDLILAGLIPQNEK